MNEIMGNMVEEILNVEICKELRNEILLARNEEQQVIVHCSAGVSMSRLKARGS